MPRILIFAKEFNLGEPISSFCEFFAFRMAEHGIECDLVVFGGGDGIPYAEKRLAGALTVYRAPFQMHANTYFNWILLMNNELKRVGRRLAEENEYVLVLANDWTSAPAASSIAAYFNIPLVTAMHSTEQNRGFSYENSQPISDLEWEACYLSKRVVAMNADCRNSLAFDLKVPSDKIITVEGLFDYTGLIKEVARQT